MAGKKIGLVIGNNYPNSNKELKFAVCDAIKIKEILENKDICGFDEVKCLLDNTSMEASSAVERTLKSAENDLVFIYFSGHGKKDFENNLCLLFKNTEEDSLVTTSLTFDSISKFIRYPSRKSVIIVLDCCYSCVAGIKDGDINVTENLKELSGFGTIILTSTGLNGSPLAREDEKLGHGIFTYYLIEGLEKGYADENNDGFISIDDLYKYAFEMTVKKGSQSPKKEGSIEGTVFIGKNPLKIKEKEYELKKKKLIQSGTQLHHRILDISLNILRKSYFNPYLMDENEIKINGYLESHLNGDFSIENYSEIVQYLQGISKTELQSKIKVAGDRHKQEVENRKHREEAKKRQKEAGDHIVSDLNIHYIYKKGMAKHEYVVAIDYGTSRTGFAWSVFGTSDADKICMCNKWPSIGPSVPKTDSALLLNEKGELISWGFDAIKNYNSKENYFFDRIKMDLYDADSNRSRGIKIVECPENGPYRVINIEKNNIKEEKKFYSVDLIAMSLSIMKNEAINTIYGCLCKVQSKEEISNSIRWVITVPAHATDAQKLLMRKSAIKAGLISSSKECQKNLLLAYEPEMAALYYYNCTKNLGIFDNELVTVVVDAGGGTVDVSAHIFNPKSGFRKLNYNIVPRTSNAGSTYLDSNFKYYLSNLFSKEIIVAFCKEKKSEWYDLLFYSDSSWESIKRGFTQDTLKMLVNVRDIEDFINENLQYQTYSVKKELENIKRHRIVLSKETFYNRICSPVFENALRPIQYILQDLEEKKLQCDVLFFAGGLSCSPFFVDDVKKGTENRVKTYGDWVYNFEKESAILKGAVLFGNDPDRWFGS